MDRDKILDALRDCGVVQVRVTYSGSGDSGQIDDVEFFDADGRHQKTAESRTVEVTENVSEPPEDGENHWREFQRVRAVSLTSVVEDFAYDALESHHGGWEINEGSQGEVVFLVKEGKIFLNHQQNIMSTEDSSDEL